MWIIFGGIACKIQGVDPYSLKHKRPTTWVLMARTLSFIDVYKGQQDFERLDGNKAAVLCCSGEELPT